MKNLSFFRKFMHFGVSGLLLLILFPQEVDAQRKDVPYVPTPQNVVEKMLDAANVGPGDYVIDLGSGDGRIVVTAAKRGAFAHGVDIDPKRISEANANAAQAGVKDRVAFIEGNIFETDFSRASVVTMYLLNSVNLKLRPKLLEELRPGTRVVSHSFSMNEWQPDKEFNEDYNTVYFWIIPAVVQGNWNWEVGNEKFSMEVSQEFQEINCNIKTGNSSLKVDNNTLSGERINFIATNPSNGKSYVYSGRVEDNTINGTVQIHTENDVTVENWSAKLN